MPLPRVSCRCLCFAAFVLQAFGLSLGLPFSVHAESNPEFRPALIGNGPNSLVNLIDTAKLHQAGQGDAVVMFDQMIFPFPVKGAYGSVYQGTPGSQLLQKAILKALNEAEFIPAIAEHKTTGVDFHGTVMFFASQKPSLRVFAHQDRGELAHFADFVAPQLIGGSTKWDANDPQLEAARRRRRRRKEGAVVLSLHVSDRGKLLSTKVISEEPAGFNFGAALLKSFASARFIPGFRNGKPVECTFEVTEPVSPYGRYRGEVSYC